MGWDKRLHSSHCVINFRKKKDLYDFSYREDNMSLFHGLFIHITTISD